MCKECNSTKVKFGNCTSILSLSGLKDHIKSSHKEKILPRGVYSVNVLESVNKIKPVNDFIKPNPFDGEAWSKTHKSDSIDGEAWSKTHKSNKTDGEAWSKTHQSNESKYYKSYLILSKLIAKCIDIDNLLEE